MSAQERISWMEECYAEFERAFAQYGAEHRKTRLLWRRALIVIDMCTEQPQREGHA